MNAHIAPARDCIDHIADSHTMVPSIRLVLPVMSSNKYWRPVRIGNHITIAPRLF